MQNSLHQFALSLIPQANYTTVLTPDDSPQNYEQIDKEGYDLTELEKANATNAGRSTGTASPTTSELDKWDYPFSIPNERMTAQKLGRRLTAAMGLPVTTLVTGSVGAFRHIWKPQNPQLEGVLPVYTYVEKSDEPADPEDITHDSMYESASIESIAFNSGAADDAYLLAASNWRASGKATDPSGVTFGDGTDHVRLVENANENSIKAAQATVKLYAQPDMVGTLHTLGCNFRNVRMNYGTGLDPSSGYSCPRFQDPADENSGTVRGEIGYGNPTIELAFSLVKTRAFAQDFNPRDKFRKDTKFSIQIDYVGVLIPGVTGTPINFVAKFKYTKLTIAQIAFPDENGRDTYDITTQPLSLGNEFPLEVEIINNVASYATLS